MNRLFQAWTETSYHRAVHSETGEAPAERWEKATPAERAVPEPGLLREAFLWSERRKADKTALVRMHGNAYQVDAWLAGRTVELLFSPFDLDRVEVRLAGKPAGAAVPFTVGRHRHPKTRTPDGQARTEPAPTGIDYLSALGDGHDEALRDLWGSRTRLLVLTWDLGDSLVLADEAAEDGPTLDPRLGEVGDRVVGPGRPELAAAMGTAPVVVSLVLGQDGPQMPLAEDQHPVGDLRPGREHEPFRIGIRARAPGRDLHGLDTGGCQDRVEHLSELACPVTDQEPSISGQPTSSARLPGCRIHAKACPSEPTSLTSPQCLSSCKIRT